MSLTVDDQRLLVVAAALHDVGHLPLSHSLEPLFRELLGIDHHEAGRWLILGNGLIPRADSLAPVLERFRLDPIEVWALISPEEAGQAPLGALLTGPLNLDTFHGIPLTASALGLSSVSAPSDCFRWASGRLLLRSEAIPACDDFWRAKDRIYRDGLNIPSSAALELEAMAKLKADGLNVSAAELVAMTDDEFLGKLRWSPASLLEEVDQQQYAYDSRGDSVGERHLRTYEVTADHPSPSRDLSIDEMKTRYVVRRQPHLLVRRARRKT